MTEGLYVDIMRGLAQDSVAWDQHESHAIIQRNSIMSSDMQHSVVTRFRVVKPHIWLTHVCVCVCLFASKCMCSVRTRKCVCLYIYIYIYSAPP